MFNAIDKYKMMDKYSGMQTTTTTRKKKQRSTFMFYDLAIYGILFKLTVKENHLIGFD